MDSNENYASDMDRNINDNTANEIRTTLLIDLNDTGVEDGTPLMSKTRQESSANPFARKPKLARSPQSSNRKEGREKEGKEKEGKEDGRANGTPVDPFAGSSRVARPPVLQKPATRSQARASLATAKETAKSAQTPTSSGNIQAPSAATSVEKTLDETEEIIMKGLHQMRSIIKAMMEALKRQPNVSKVIKDGLPALEEAVDALDESRKLHKEACLRKTHKRTMEGADAPQTPASSQVTASQTPVSHSTNTAPKNSVTGKRGATSPLLPATEKKRKQKKDETDQTGWIEVVRKGKRSKAAEGETKAAKKKKKKKKRKNKKAVAVKEIQTNTPAPNRTAQKKTRPEAILLKPAEGRTYADVLSTVRKTVKPENCGVEIKAVRQTRTGEVLLELKKSTPDNRAAFSDALKKAVGSSSSVRELVPKASLEIRDLDGCTTKEEVLEALGKNLDGFDGHIQVGVTRPNERGLCMALVTLDETAARRLMRTARLRVGWVTGKIRRRVSVTRCFKCLGYGHRSQSCKGPDRSKLCFRCGTEGHKSRECTATPLCFLCPDIEGKAEARRHMAGSGACETFRKALSVEKAK